jgi:predicted amidohydrolase YtcJ
MTTTRMKATLALLFGMLYVLTAAAQDEPLLLTNGNILTLNQNDAVADSVLLHRGRIVAVDDSSSDLADTARVIDLDGRTVVPGLYDSHMHFIRGTLRPGHDMRALEEATSIAELLEEISRRADTVPDGEWVTGIGGWDPVQFLGENRFPTLDELDTVATDHPFYMHLRANGPGVTNSLGKAILEDNGITVDDNGLVAMGGGPDKAIAAFDYLKSQQTHEDRVRGAREFMQRANSLGLTAVRDQGGTPRPGAQLFEPYKDYETLLGMWRNDDLTMRVRLMFMSSDDIVGDGEGDSGAEQRMRNAFMGFGDDMLRIAGIGENIVTDSRGPAFVSVAKIAAQRGWSLEQHSSQPAENTAHIAAFEEANEVASIADLRWTLTHVQQITPEIAQRLKTLGGGVTVQDHRYLNRGNVTNNQGGPPLRMLADMGVPIGGGTDSTNAQPMNPWYSIYYMVSGRNVGGHHVNAGQELTRLEALKTYTLGSAWVSQDDDNLGSVEVGKLADLVVLSDNYLTVSESDIRKLTSVLTLLNGEIVYSDSAIGLDSD